MTGLADVDGFKLFIQVCVIALPTPGIAREQIIHATSLGVFVPILNMDIFLVTIKLSLFNVNF